MAMNLRLKMHSYPGDVLKRIKVAMLEGKKRIALHRFPNKLYKENLAKGKSFKKTLRMKERAVLKERTKKEIEATISNHDE